MNIEWRNAIIDMNAERIDRMICSGIDVNCIFGKIPRSDVTEIDSIYDNNTALTKLCGYNSIHREDDGLFIIKILVEKYRADVNVCTSVVSPLYRAAVNNLYKIVDYLVDNGASIDYVGMGNRKHVIDVLSKSKIHELNFQENIITKQPWNIKLFDDKVGFLPELKVKYEDAFYISDLAI